MMLMIVALIVWVAYERSSTRPAAALDPQHEARPVVARGDLAEDEKATIEIFKRTAPNVVYIRNIGLRRDFFTRDIFKIQGAGSGFVYDPAGYIVTNLHVIRGADSVVVTLADHSEHEAKVVGFAPDKDLAVLKLDDVGSDTLRAIAVGTSGDLQVGQKVFAIGNPFGLDHTLTTGIVSALGREIDSLVDGRMIEDVIQTDAAINPGNSGGPLLDSAGRLIGVNTQIASPSGGSAGIGFAIPVDTVVRVVTQIIQHGRVIRSGIGATIVPDRIAQRLGYTGVMLNEIQPGSGAQRAGLKGLKLSRDGTRIDEPGDIIIAVGDRTVAGSNDLLNALEPHAIGEKVEITYRRGEQVLKATVTLQAIE